MNIEELKKIEERSMRLMEILNENEIEFKYDSGWGGYTLYEDDYEVVCKDENELEEYMESYLGIYVIDEECYHCHTQITEYSYVPTIYYNDGTEERIEEIITGMTQADMRAYEDDIKKENPNVRSVKFAEYCPLCLSEM